CCVALMLAWRNDRALPSSRWVASMAMPAARRFTSPRTRTVAMTPKASMAAAANTSTLIMSVGSSVPGRMGKSASIGSDLEAHHAIHDEVAHQHPGAGGAQRKLGEVDVPHAGVKIWRDDLEDEEQHDRHGRQQDRRESSFRRQRPHLAPHL